MRTLITCGGTGGHIFPAIALAQELKKRDNSQVIFVIGNKLSTKELIKKAGFRYFTISVPKMPYGFSLDWLGFVPRLIRSRIQADEIVAKINPDIAIGFGAYLSGPVISAAISMKIKTVIHEQNASLGRANRLLLHKVDRACFSFDDKVIKKNNKYRLTGNPIRRELLDGFKMITKEEALTRLGFFAQKKTVLVLGGSGGSSFINKLFIDFAKSLSDKERLKIQFLHITGRNDFEFVSENYRFSDVDHWVRDSFDKMALLYKAADIIVCRAGATTIAELALFGLPAIFIPYPWAGGHQRENASVIARNGAAILLEEKDVTISRLKKELTSTLNDSENINTMRVNMQKFSNIDATAHLTDEIGELLNA